jgi:hypothetical protein
MHAIEFLRMDLIGVDHRGLGERQLLAAAPDRRLGSAAGYTGHVEHRMPPWCGDAGNPDPKRVGDKRLGRGMRCLGHLTSGNPCEMRNDSVGDRIIHPIAIPNRRPGESRDPLIRLLRS